MRVQTLSSVCIPLSSHSMTDPRKGMLMHKYKSVQWKAYHTKIYFRKGSIRGPKYCTFRKSADRITRRWQLLRLRETATEAREITSNNTNLGCSWDKSPTDWGLPAAACAHTGSRGRPFGQGKLEMPSQRRTGARMASQRWRGCDLAPRAREASCG